MGGRLWQNPRKNLRGQCRSRKSFKAVCTDVAAKKTGAFDYVDDNTVMGRIKIRTDSGVRKTFMLVACSQSAFQRAETSGEFGIGLKGNYGIKFHLERIPQGFGLEGFIPNKSHSRQIAIVANTG